MSWVRIDDTAPDHPKLIGLGDEAFALWVRALCYCARHLTDGRVPQAALRTLSRSRKPAVVAAELVAAGLWEAQDGSYQVHDYLGYNPSAADVRARRESKQEAGRKGGIRSGEVRSGTASKNEAPASGLGSTSNEAGASGSASGSVQPNRTPDPVPIPSRSRPVPIPGDSHTHTGTGARADGRASARGEVEARLADAGGDVRAIFAELDACELFRRSAALTEQGAGRTLLTLAEQGAGMRTSSSKPLQAYIDAARDAASKLTAEASGNASPPAWSYLGRSIGAYFRRAGDFNANGARKPARLITQPRRDTYEVKDGVIDD